MQGSTRRAFAAHSFTLPCLPANALAVILLLGRRIRTGDRRFLQTDERGSVIAVTNSAGSLLAANTYDEYGIPGASNLGRFQYTGQAWLSEISLAYYKARMYDPKLGRFMQTDPTGYDDGPNWYAYVENDPTNKTDPTGEIGIVGFVIGAGIETAVQVGSNVASGQSFREALTNVDVGDVLVAGAVSAVIPGIGNVVKTGAASAKAIANSVKATKALARQAARTANRAAKLDQRMASHGEQISNAVNEAAAAVGTAAVHQIVKKAGQEVTPPVTPGAHSDAPAAAPAQALRCIKDERAGGGCK